MTTSAAHVTRPTPAAAPTLADNRPDQPAGALAHVVPVAGRVTPVASPGDPGRTIRRAPSDFGTSTATTLKSGWGLLGIGSTPWDAILVAIRGYAALRADQYDQRVRSLAALPALLLAWERHHEIGTKAETDLKDDEKRKVTAIRELRTLLDREHRELATAGAKVDPRTRTIDAHRLTDDYLLEQVAKGHTTLKRDDQGLAVTRLQQALADLGHLAPGQVTGTYDAATETGVQAFQRANALPETGVLARPTMAKLVEAFRRHGAERRLATASTVETKPVAGEYGWGSAPDELTAGARDLTDPERAAAKEAVKTAQTAGPGGVQPTFVSDLPGRGRYEDRLKRLVLALVELEYDYLARGKAAKRNDDDLFGWDHIAVVANRAKRVTDAVFGQWSIGPALTPGVSIHDAWETKVEALKDVDVQDDAAVWRVTKLLTGNEQVRDLDREHGAIQSRGPEKAIVDRVRAAVVVAKRDKLLETHKAWPAFADAGVVNIQRFKKAGVAANRHEMWDLFQTVVHEYLHTLEHSRYRGYRETLGQQAGGFTLREGVVEYFTHTVLEAVDYNEELRAAVEGEFHEDGVTQPIPAYRGYGERANAEKLAGVVGATNVMAAFFLGDVEKVGGTA